MKTTLKQLATATFIALFIMVINVKAEGIERILLNNENTEASLSLEKWMIDETIWNMNNMKNAEFIQEVETSLDLEDWMVNAATWTEASELAIEAESTLSLEDWMITDKTWNPVINGLELRLRIESWMISEDTWK